VAGWCLRHGAAEGAAAPSRSAGADGRPMWKTNLRRDFSGNYREKVGFGDCVTSVGSGTMPGLRTAKLSGSVGCHRRTGSTGQQGRVTEGV